MPLPNQSVSDQTKPIPIQNIIKRCNILPMLIKTDLDHTATTDDGTKPINAQTPQNIPNLAKPMLDQPMPKLTTPKRDMNQIICHPACNAPSQSFT